MSAWLPLLGSLGVMLAFAGGYCIPSIVRWMERRLEGPNEVSDEECERIGRLVASKFHADVTVEGMTLPELMKLNMTEPSTKKPSTNAT